MNILLFGPPGSGKGTQSELLVSNCGMVHVSTGDIFRREVKQGTALGRKAKEYMDAGSLVPDEVVIAMVEGVLKGLKGQKFILDGFPRTCAQAEALNQMLKANDMTLDRAVFLEVPRSELIRRLTGRRTCSGCGAVYHEESKKPKVPGVCDLCGQRLVQRPDDMEEVVSHRLETYDTNTSPLRDFYRKSGQYAEVVGTGEVDEIQQRIRKVLN